MNKTIKLSATRYKHEVRLHLDNRSDLEIKELLDKAQNKLFLNISCDIWGQDLPDKHVVTYPADWWQALKERFAPAWFRVKWPVRSINVTVSARELFPNFKPALPDEASVLHMNVNFVEDDGYYPDPF